MLPKPPIVEGDGECYVCGALHPRGLHMTFALSGGEELIARVTFGAHHAGGDGAVHIGFVTMVLDEMAVELLLHQGVANVSTEMRITRGAPLRPGEEIECRARRQREKGPLVEVIVEARRGHDVIAHGTVLCIRTDAGALRRRTSPESASESPPV